MKKLKTALFVLLPAVMAVAITAMAVTGRTDCPGTRICPLTGEVVCTDRCPVGDATDCCAARADRR